MTESVHNDSEIQRAARDAFARLIKGQDEQGCCRTLNVDWTETPLGPLIAIGDDNHLYMLTYIDQTSLERKAALVRKKLEANLEEGRSAAITSIFEELSEYFAGRRQYFETPVSLLGTSFQERVWKEMRKVAYATTISYTELAHRIDKPAAFRAVAQANAQNPLAIVVPDHRVINTDGAPGGYNAGVERKRWLLEFEQGVLNRDDD